MPATVRISESARVGLRAVLIILAAVVLLIPVIVSTAQGASRLDYGRIEASEPLPKAMKELKIGLDSGGAVDIKAADVAEATVKLTGTGPRDSSANLEVDSRADTAEVDLKNAGKLENTRLTVTMPTSVAKDLALDFDGNYGRFDVTGDFAEINADTGGGTANVTGSAKKVRTSSDWGATYFDGEFGTVSAKTGVGAIEGENLTVSDRIDVVSSTGTVDLDFTNQAMPTGGIIAKTEEGSIDMRVPNLELTSEELDEDFFYRINAKSNDGTVDLASDLEKFDVAEDPKEAKGKTLVPISATADTGTVTVNQN